MFIIDTMTMIKLEHDCRHLTHAAHISSPFLTDPLPLMGRCFSLSLSCDCVRVGHVKSFDDPSCSRQSDDIRSFHFDGKLFSGEKMNHSSERSLAYKRENKRKFFIRLCLRMEAISRYVKKRDLVSDRSVVR